MKFYFLVFCTLTFTQAHAQLIYPKAKKVSQSDDYFGKKVSDPYRWLEDDNAADTKAWVQEENRMTYDYLEKIPYRSKIRERLTGLWNFERMNAPFKKGELYFYSKNNGLQNQNVLYYEKGFKTNKPILLLDPNKLSEDGTVSLSGMAVSKDCKYLAYAISKAGSDWEEIHVMDIATKAELSDKLEWVKFSNIAWQGNGFYYSRYDAPESGKAFTRSNEFHKIYFHIVGKPQSKDMILFEDKQHANSNISMSVTEDERFLILSGNESTSGQSIMIKDLNSDNPKFETVADNFDNDYSIIDNVGDDLYVLTNNKAPKYRLIRINCRKLAEAEWTTLITEKSDLLESAHLCGGKIIAKYLKDVSSRLYQYDLKGNMLKEVKLNGLCKIDEFHSTIKETQAFYSSVSFTAPSTVYIFDAAAAVSKVYFKPKINFKPEDYETKQVFYTSKDGTKIPMFITHKKGIELNGNNPCFLFGYGGFNISYTPEFRIDRAVFLEAGGIYAVANMRGGGEYGEDWHKAGTKCKKQNVFDDYIAAAEYLVNEKYTSHQKLAIHGRSNGGLLIGAVMTQRPDLAKVCIPTVGVLDMLRYHKFTIGRSWSVDYGLSENKEEFDCLYKYSPLHNVKKVAYPATLILTGDHDDRVVPAHSFKFAATLQENQTGKEPVLIRVDVNAGHGSGKPTDKQIAEFADMWSFVFYNLGMAY
ncbi:MAG: prolyl oligopeptidase family serine peptidase [Bacteroidia bacterium]